MARAVFVALADLRDRLEPLWVGGLAILILGLGSLTLGVGGERYEWAQYLLLGTVYPASVLALTLIGLKARPIRLGLAALGVAAGLAFVGGHVTPAILGIATLNWVVAQRWRSTSRVDAFASWLVIVFGWAAASRLCYWMPFEAWVTGSRWAIATFLAALVAISLGFGRTIEGQGEPRSWNAVDWIAVPVLFAAGFRVDSLGGPDRFPDTVGLGQFAFFHWGPLVGPAELVRQGGWPLWDVPCQYGFLNTWIVAALPFSSVWQSFYTVNGLLTALSALILYAILRAAAPGRLAPWLCLTLAAASVYLVPGDLRLSTGPSISPAVGAYRFFWCYALLGILAIGLNGPLKRSTLLVGSLAWLIGTLWSCESATYCAAVWLPAFAWIVIRGQCATWLLLPPVLLGLSVASIAGVYIGILGHWPDPRAFFDYSFANIQGYGEPVDPYGVVWVPILLLCVLAALIVSLFEQGARSQGVALATAAWGTVWAACSYFVARSDPGLILNLSPILCAALASAFFLLGRFGIPNGPDRLIRAALMPVAIVLISLATGNAKHLPDWIDPLRRVYIGRIESRLPTMSNELRTLLDQAGVKSSDPVCYIDDSRLLNALPVRRGTNGPERWEQRAWMPTLPFSLFLPLPGDRGQVYLDRFTKRSQLGGWLVEPRASNGSLRWFYDGVARTHVPEKSIESAHWKVTRFDTRPLLATGKRAIW